ncbi:hypothetical protein G6F36_011054 [Rhizopus arrhizus]|nr:hypothetical protein G6F36_011054 [Rhizopus arrhizus]
MHQHIVPPHVDDSSKLNTLQTSIFRTSRTKGAFLFDISSCKEKYTDQQCMIILKEQHPSVHACVPLNDGPRRYLEVYIIPQNDNNDILNQGLTFKEANLRIYPRASLDDNAKIVNLKLNHLPLLPKKDVLSGLQRSLAVFGEIMDTTKLQGSDDDSDESDYDNEEMEDVSESLDKEDEQTIDQDEILQLKQDLQPPVHTSTNVLQMNQTIGQDEGLITSPKQNTQATAMDSTMNDIHGQHGELSAFRTGTHSEVHTGTSNSHIYHL